jgi:hypothetical protein
MKLGIIAGFVVAAMWIAAEVVSGKPFPHGLVAW